MEHAFQQERYPAISTWVTRTYSHFSFTEKDFCNEKNIWAHGLALSRRKSASGGMNSTSDGGSSVSGQTNEIETMFLWHKKQFISSYEKGSRSDGVEEGVSTWWMWKAWSKSGWWVWNDDFWMLRALRWGWELAGRGYGTTSYKTINKVRCQETDNFFPCSFP